MSKYVVFSGPYFPVFNPNTGKYGPGKSPYLDNFYAVESKFNLSFRFPPFRKSMWFISTYLRQLNLQPILIVQFL